MLGLLFAQLVSSLIAPATQTDLTNVMMNQAQRATRTLDANGNDTWVFPQAFIAEPDGLGYFPKNLDITGKPIACNYQALTATYVTYHCDKSSGVLANLLQSVFDNKGAAGATIKIVARGTIAQP